ncbi:hypothetical protein [Mucilaginibacter myungsuensis]|uniref:Uncharacterized protein n=1 Tax=Mucilaginibacter myungsuensis TaxID=649104 RepID=A0A929L6L1_9SPHI|nr:hypothetical protein [Mucilaginibacter myungsuensis]MBE9664141.1 hypothetical protein [Mucilaginibacter myungsuensis]MDN3601320.1 hypothetical protein [Mucilaginibacter myungsuensis]
MTKLFAILLFVFNLQTPQMPEENMVDGKSIKVTNASGGSFGLGTPDDLQKAFGKAQIVTVADEVLGGTSDYYRYKGLQVFFHDKKCELITVKSPFFRFMIGGQTFKVGDNIAKLKALFPLSFKSKRDNFIRLGIKDADAWVAFTYNVNGLVTSIEVANDNS